jgi:hypothetical protein
VVTLETVLGLLGCAAAFVFAGVLIGRWFEGDRWAAKASMKTGCMEHAGDAYLVVSANDQAACARMIDRLHVELDRMEDEQRVERIRSGA